MLETRNEKWALNTCKISSSPEKMPHFQPFKTYYFPKINENKSGEVKLLPSDHISQIPNLKQINTSSPKFVDKKSTCLSKIRKILNKLYKQGKLMDSTRKSQDHEQ